MKFYNNNKVFIIEAELISKIIDKDYIVKIGYWEKYYLIIRGLSKVISIVKSYYFICINEHYSIIFILKG